MAQSTERVGLADFPGLSWSQLLLQTSEFDSKDRDMGLFFIDILDFLKGRWRGYGLEPRIHRLDLERLSEHQLRDLNLHERLQGRGRNHDGKAGKWR